MLSMPEVRVGEPIRHESLGLFPLFTDTMNDLDYRLSDEAISDGAITVEEISQQGSVPELKVNNPSGSRVLFLEGEELHGREAEPGAEHECAGGGREPGVDSGELRGGGALAVALEDVFDAGDTLFTEAAGLAEGVGHALAPGEIGASVGSRGGLGGGGSPECGFGDAIEDRGDG